LDWFGNAVPESDKYHIDCDEVAKTYPLAPTPGDADFALVVMRTPMSPGFDDDDLAAGGSGYVPISLQYGPYAAPTARERSIAGGDPLEKGVNRAYRGKEAIVYNRSDLTRFMETRKALGDKPLVVILKMDKPTIVREFEPHADAILVDFGVGAAALMDIVSGRQTPSGLLPLQIPRDMETVEAQAEDMPRDMEPHRDSEGNVYDFAFGMDFTAVIDDDRVKKYR
ncbi:MAG: glycoside hydrolase family 3 C-terminal domain-containing protein, partial [Planctomycetota bacterium]|nr:glycoside hydrolase family 3 C-terminal domain-containing protein [Planctomycetota bacterium]